MFTTWNVLLVNSVIIGKLNRAENCIIWIALIVFQFCIVEFELRILIYHFLDFVLEIVSSYATTKYSVNMIMRNEWFLQI